MKAKIILTVLKYLLIFSGVVFIIVSPLISSTIECASGKGCKNLLRDTGGLIFNSQQNIKEDVIRITEEAPKNPEIYDRRIINNFKADILVNLTVWIFWIVLFVLLARAIFGKATSHLFAITVIAVPFAMAMTGLLGLLWNLFTTGQLVNPYEGLWLLFKNPQVLKEIGSTFTIQINNITEDIANSTEMTLVNNLTTS